MLRIQKKKLKEIRGDPMKETLIDDLNFKNCLRLGRKKTSKFFVGITF